ncbi:MAG: DEAD/DEAH box helicase family protein, partial [Thermoleophilaceae bacterium]
MAESTSVAASAPVSGDDLTRAEDFAREPFVLEGEDAAVALAEGMARRGALDEALAEIEQGLDEPSVQWRGRWSLILGLERLLAQEEPKLVDGTVLSAHQVDALSGTLIALTAEVQSARNGGTAGAGTADASSGANGAEPDDVADDAIADEPAADEDDLDGPDEDDDIDADASDEDEDDEDGEDAADEDEDEDDEPLDWDAREEAEEEAAADAVEEDPGANRRFWFEHATGAGKTVAALGFVEASRTGGVLILTHRRNLVDQFNGELKDRGYRKRICAPLLGKDRSPVEGPVTVETYQWYVRNAGKVSDAYTIVICDEAHTALGEKTSASIRQWDGPVFVGMTATGALIARHVTDLFPTQTSRFDLAQAARRGV